MTGAPPVPDASATAAFTRGVAPFAGFGEIGDPGRFVPLPADWMVGVADVVASTQAIAEGHYKSVNTAGAAVISAVSNALGTLDFPFVFAGDGASFAVAAADAETAGAALAATVGWVGQALGLTLRAALVPLLAVREQGLDVLVARFSASADVAYAMFAGGGLAWVERRLKDGEIGLPAAPPGARPDLTGLSCRFRNLPSRNGVILSLLVRPVAAATEPRFRALVADVLALTEGASEGATRPVPVTSPLGHLHPGSIDMNARLVRRPGEGRLASLARSAGHVGLLALLQATDVTVGGFSAAVYLRQVAANSDFRKFSDALMLTLDCPPALADAVERRLVAAAGDGVADFGLHRQDAATVTCLIPSATAANHVHFIDGASGGYAMAAHDLKLRLASTPRL